MSEKLTNYKIYAMKITLSDGTVKEYKNSDAEALDILRHSTAHLMARAIMRLYFPL